MTSTVDQMEFAIGEAGRDHEKWSQLAPLRFRVNLQPPSTQFSRGLLLAPFPLGGNGWVFTLDTELAF